MNQAFGYLHSAVTSVVIRSGPKFRLLQRMTAERATGILMNGNSGVGDESALLWVDEDKYELVVDEPVSAIEALTVPRRQVARVWRVRARARAISHECLAGRAWRGRSLGDIHAGALFPLTRPRILPLRCLF
ncbi:MAG: hypothetical protein ACI8PT_004448 [Gammaproteobacteria bacterium]